MSLIEVKIGALSLSPRVRERNGRLFIETSGLVRLCTLGSYARTVIVDPAMRRVDVGVRHIWAWERHRFIPFSRVDHVEYRFDSLTTSIARTYGATDQLEKFSIELVLDDDERVLVADFRGAGSIMTGMTGVLSGDSLIDYAGTQEDVSRALVERLVEILGVPLGKPLASARVRVCSACGRYAAVRDTRCNVCGGEIARA